MGINPPPPTNPRPNPPCSPPPPKFKGERITVVQPKEEDSTINQLVGLYLLGKLFRL